MNDFEKWMVETFKLSMRWEGGEHDRLLVNPVPHPVRLTPMQAARLVSYIVTWLGDTAQFKWMEQHIDDKGKGE